MKEVIATNDGPLAIGPARSCIQVAELPQGARVEIEAIACPQ